MCKFFRRGFSAAVLLVMVLSMLVLPQGSAEAGKAPVHELNYFKSYEIPIRIVPQNLSFFEQIQKSLQKFVEGEDKTKEAIELPNEIEVSVLNW